MILSLCGSNLCFLSMGNRKGKQAEAEVVPSSSLVEVGVEVAVKVGVKVGVEVEVEGSGLGLNLLFRSGGWVVGGLESKANLNSSCS